MKIKRSLFFLFSVLWINVLNAGSLYEFSVPQDNNTLVFINLDSTRNSPLKPIMEEFTHYLLSNFPMRYDIIKELLDNTQVMLFAANTETYESSSGYLRGKFSTKQVEALIGEIRKLNPHISSQEIATGTIYKIGSFSMHIRNNEIVYAETPDLLHQILLQNNTRQVDFNSATDITNTFFITALNDPKAKEKPNLQRDVCTDIYTLCFRKENTFIFQLIQQAVDEDTAVNLEKEPLDISYFKKMPQFYKLLGGTTVIRQNNTVTFEISKDFNEMNASIAEIVSNLSTPFEYISPMYYSYRQQSKDQSTDNRRSQSKKK